MSASSIFFIAVFCVVMVMIFLVRHLCEKIELLKTMNDTLERQKDAFAAELARYRNAQEIVSENRRQADAKVDGLHSGDALGNALDELHKRTD